jgi:membrane dipeptidase
MKKFNCFLLPLFCCQLLAAQSYRKIHEKAILVDTHNDVLSTVVMKGLNIENDLSGKAHSDIARFKKGGVGVQVFSIFCDEHFGKDTAFKYANIEIDSLYAIVKRNPGKMMMVSSPKELRQALKERKLACMMGVEGGHMIENRMDYLDSLFKRGVRYMTLTWNNSTNWASSAKDESAPDSGTVTQSRKKGLTEFGMLVVRHMNELGMLVDVSHVGEQTFRDAIRTSTKPVIASHSSVYALCPVFRNLKDEQIKAIGDNGGVIFVNFYSGFLNSNYTRHLNVFLETHRQETDSLKAAGRPGYEIQEWLAKKYPAEAQAGRPPLSLLIDHIDYIVKLVGVNHVDWVPILTELNLHRPGWMAFRTTRLSPKHCWKEATVKRM